MLVQQQLMYQIDIGILDKMSGEASPMGEAELAFVRGEKIIEKPKRKKKVVEEEELEE